VFRRLFDAWFPPVASGAAPVKLIVGLGNPGQKYRDTRHNVGFDAIDRLVAEMGSPSPRGKFDGDLYEGRLADTSVALLKPATFMNLSGSSVQPAVAFYKLDLTDVLIVCDDFAIPLGTLRIRPKGSSGGQNGLKSIFERLGTDAVPRVRIGIGPVPARWNPADFVLGKFTEDERLIAAKAVTSAAEAARAWLSGGLELCMNNYNGKMVAEAP
jgi:PTH1 family peptidyl-tRNA hydrolase